MSRLVSVFFLILILCRSDGADNHQEQDGSQPSKTEICLGSTEEESVCTELKEGTMDGIVSSFKNKQFLPKDSNSEKDVNVSSSATLPTTLGLDNATETMNFTVGSSTDVPSTTQQYEQNLETDSTNSSATE
ncbi:uncharacterized protein LOC106661092 [Cimex lectularius]|uniref:Uncharacterized protein n=1 Tax=Cimex lectularius TaxID=79782 RepID=A0A8I6R9H1_CIMLE|nr:uncharacterized protein LOC106661092 [Cimex lectularius]